MRILNAGDKCTQLDLNSKLIGDLFLIINVFSFSLKEQTSFRTEITVPQIHIYTLYRKLSCTTYQKDNQSPARSAFFIATGQILSVEGIIMEEISGTGTTENSSVSKQAARNRKVIKYRKRTYLFHLPNHNSGLSLAVSLRS